MRIVNLSPEIVKVASPLASEPVVFELSGDSSAL
jgi:hypothetical protein